MKPKPKSEEYSAFENLLERVLKVPKAELSKRKESGEQKKVIHRKSHQDKPAHS